MSKRTMSALTGMLMLLSLGLFWASEADAQIAPTAASRTLRRGMIQSRFTNIGMQGATIDEIRPYSIGLVYPRETGGDVVDGGSWKGMLVTHSHDCNSEAHVEKNSYGEGVWLSLPIPASFAGSSVDSYDQDGYYVVYTNPRGDLLPEIAPMFYDPREDPEMKDLGLEKFVPVPSEDAGLEWRRSTYYPGTEWVDDELGDAPMSRTPPEIQNYDFYRYIPNDDWPEEIILTQWGTLAGVTFKRRALQWSYRDWDDFFIVEVEFENTGDSDGDGVRDLPEETLDDVYISFVNALGVSGAGTTWRSADRWFRFWYWAIDDHAKYSESPNYSGPAAGKNLKISYHFDGDNPQTPLEDTGDPVEASIQSSGCNTGRIDGEFTSFQFGGMAPLAYANGGDKPFNGRDAVKGYVDPAGEQPHAVRWWKSEGENVFDDPRAAVHGRKEIYNMATTAQIDPDPSGVAVWFSHQTYGPYTLAPGQKGKIVMAYVMGSGAGEGDIFTWTRANTRNQTELAKGETWMVEFAERANWAYQNDYDLPDAPPDVYVVTSPSDQATNLLTWGAAGDDAEDPDYAGTAEGKDVAGYRIYRAEWTPDGPWYLHDQTSKDALAANFTRSGDTYVYNDVSSVAGFNYWYSVRAYDTGHDEWQGSVGSMATLPSKVASHVKAGLEGGYVADEQKAPIPATPAMAANTPSDRLDRDVFVVPNPFRLDGTHNYPGTNGVRFMNVPRKCEIFVFSSSGDLVGHFGHDDTDKTSGQLGEVTWGQMATSMTGEMASGVFFFVVKSLMPESEGKIQRGKFFIIR